MTDASDAYRAGRRARLQGKPITVNPFATPRPSFIRSLKAHDRLKQRWHDGWTDQDWLMEIEKEKNGKT